VERERPGLSSLIGGNTVYRLFLDNTNEKSTGGEDAKFLMAAKKKSGKGTSYYLVSAEKNPDDRGSMYLLGKV
jgi:hypothetical protein